MKLLKKEFRLCMHPSAYIMLCLGALVLAPNYPYGVSFFYITLSIFFICLSGRENHDAAFTMSLPVSRREAVRGRILMACCLELAQLAVCGIFIIIKNLMGPSPNEVGMDANLALIGEGFIIFSVFNCVFFPMWYGDISKVGKPFTVSAVLVFVYIIAAVCACYAVPFVRDVLDTPDPQHTGAKLLFSAACLCLYSLSTALAAKTSAGKFEKLDLQL